VRDDRGDMIEAFQRARERSEIVLVSGGLGPTRDDLTIEVLAEAFGRKLVLHEPSLAAIRAFFARFGREMAKNNEKQAWFPEGAEVLPNPVGTAPGTMLREGGALFFCMPGVPHELQRMMDEQVLPRIAASRSEGRGGRVVRSRLLRTFGLGESNLDALLADVAIDGDVVLGFRTAFPDNYLRPLTRGETAAEAKRATCSERSRVLGVERIIEIDTTSGPLLGNMQYRDIDFLRPGEVVLTFDDGPLRRHTKSVLNALEAHCTKATFFMVGRMAAARMELEEEDLAVGKTIELENREWRICGRFAAPGTVLEAELWARLDDLMVATKREDVSCVAVRLKSPDELDALSLFAAKRVDLEMVAVPEEELMAALQRSLGHITALARLMAALVLVAGGFACANTMFAAVLARTKELAMLRTLGYSPASVAASIVQEAMLVAFLGAALGLAAATLVGDIPLRFPMGALHLELDTLHRGLGLGAALAAGLLGGLVPAIHAVRTPLVDGLAGKN